MGAQNENDMIDGYSSIDPNKRANLIIGYSEVGQKNNITKNHDYASIKETQVSKHINNNDDDEGSDIYSSIPSTDTAATPFQYNYSTINTPTSLLTENSPGYSSISDTRHTTPSTESNSSDTHNDIIARHSSSITSRPNRYESLTESESDPNYESVKYINTKENPYERLHNEKSPEPLSTAATTPLSLNDVSPIWGSNGIIVSPTTTTKLTKSNSENLEVGDYFQV